MILGATGSGTDAIANRPLKGGWGKHTMASGGMCWGSVISTPGTGSAGSDSVGAAELVDEAVPPVRMAMPPVVFSQPTATPAPSQSRIVTPASAYLERAGSSVARKRKREFPFHVLVRPIRQVDSDPGDGAAGERKRCLVAARHSRTAVAPDGDAGPRQPERSGMGRHIGQRADHLVVDEQREVTERGVAVWHRSRPRIAHTEHVPAQRHRA